MDSQLSDVCAGSLFRSLESKLNSDSSDEREMILKQNLDVLVPKYIWERLVLRSITESICKCRELTEARSDFHITHNAFCFPHKILHKLLFSNALGNS